MNISKFEKCSNCGACYNICPKDAIAVEKEGLFYSLSVDSDLCIDCGLCSNICPVNNDFETMIPLYACAGWHKDQEVVLNSSSGGVFFGIANKIIEEGGIVFGAEYSEDCKTVVFSSTDETDISKLLRSKYVESQIELSFRKVKVELEKGRKVLFCGTPCQVAGLCRFLEKPYDHLITCDFACGGLPSHALYQKYLSSLEEKYGSSIKSVDFRPKTHGWKRYAVRICFENGKVYNRLGVEDKYLKSFLYGKCTVRDYCLECKFSDNHASDITIADFWLHEKLSSLRNENGISLILCNSSKGKDILEVVGEQFVFAELDLDSATYNHKKTETSENTIRRRQAFLMLCDEKNLRTACETILPCSFKNKLKNRVARIICRKRRG